jgi:gliding motility-associated-like protein
MGAGINKALVFVTLISLLQYFPLFGQDTERPLPPFLENVTVNPATGFSTLTWQPGGSPDVAGYVLYNYINGAGEAFDTIFNPLATNYIDLISNASLFSVSYMVAAIDSSDNISPLSNFLNTIFITASLDTCNHGIRLKWNGFNTDNHIVEKYTLYSSVDGALFSEVEITQPEDTTLFYSSITTGSEYCFYVAATHNGTIQSFSNRVCLTTDIIRPPNWINGDFATIEGDYLNLSFSFDQLSEIELFNIEISDTPYGPYSILQSVHSSTGNVNIQLISNPSTLRYYRMSAINNCNQIVISSNPLSIIVPRLVDNNNSIFLTWNSYQTWVGGVDLYRVFRNSDGSFIEIGQNMAGDTTFIDNPYSFIYGTSEDSVCYKIVAEEGANPYFNNGQSSSTIVCTPAPVKIFTPTMFTPNGDGDNDTFKPIFSFTPKKYRLIIKNRSGVTMFESRNHLDEWDGQYRGETAPEDVYLWFLEIETDTGRELVRHGTITIF